MPQEVEDQHVILFTLHQFDWGAPFIPDRDPQVELG